MGETKNRSRADRLTRIVVGIGFAVVLFAMALSSGWISLPFPGLPSFGEIDVAVNLPDGARIINIEPISLDCRARVHAEVPVEGRREHKLGEFVYRVDTITMTAIGDVDTCVDGGAAEITFHRDGSTEVTIPGPSIRFVRPRVDATKTASTVDVDRGILGKLADAFPWVDDNLGLTPSAYAYAQGVIGSSECMRSAYEVTEGILVDAYRQQAIDQGVDAEDVTVRIEGEPVFEEPAPVELGGVEFDEPTEITCVVSGDLEN